MIDTNRKYQAGDTFRRADGSPFSIPRGTNPLGDWTKSTIQHFIDNGAYLWVEPTIDTATQKPSGFAPVMQDGVQVGVTQEVVAKTQVELDTEAAQAIADNCVAIDDAARSYAEHRLQPVGMVLVDRMMRYPTPNPKAQAVDTWMQSLYVESEYRKALCLAGLGPMDGSELDFSSFGEKPYTVAQLMAEYTGL